MENNSTGYISVIGQNLVKPILELIEKLESIPVDEPNDLQTTSDENGFSCSIIVLNLILLESAFNRTKYIRKENQNKAELVDYFSKLLQDNELINHVDEIIAVRDAIVHNHIWEGDILWDENYKIKTINNPKLIDIYGNKRQRRVMNNKLLLSHNLKLNLFPLKIWRRDAYITFHTVYKVLAKLERINPNYFMISNHYYDFANKELQTLDQIVSNLHYLQESN